MSRPKETTWETLFNLHDLVYATDVADETPQGRVIEIRMHEFVGGSKVEYKIDFGGQFRNEWIEEKYLTDELPAVDELEPIYSGMDLNDAIYAQYDRENA